MSLILHTGAESIDRAGLANLPMPRPMGARHVIRPFIQDVEVVADALSQYGLMIADESYGVKYNDGMPGQFFGLLEIAPKVLHGEVITAREFALQVGIRGAYDQSLARGLAVGSRVFVCDNLAFSGQVNVQTKQTTNLDRRIVGLLQEAVSRVPVMAEYQEKRFISYKSHALRPRAGDAALIECVRRGILNPSNVGKAIQEWDAPTYPEHAADGHSLWTLQNAVTEAIKPPKDSGRADVLPAWDRTTKLTAFLDEFAGL